MKQERGWERENKTRQICVLSRSLWQAAYGPFFAIVGPYQLIVLNTDETGIIRDTTNEAFACSPVLTWYNDPALE